MRRHVTLYNIIFPLWFLLFFPFFPPLFLAAAAGNLVIDGAVITLSLRVLRQQIEKGPLRSYILKAWLYGFLFDFIGAAVLLGLEALNLLEPGSFYTIWDSSLTVVAYFIVIGLVGMAIYVVNRKLSAKAGVSINAAHKVALNMAIITAPWVFLVPTSFFHRAMF
ncbi:MAG: hypothetical protein ACOYEO_08625 [bacterium]|jgi:hypothetical protein